MRLADLPARRVAEALHAGRLRLKTGPFATCVGSRDARIVEGIAQQYAAHQVLDDNAFCDFHVRLDGGQGLRRWLKPQARFLFDGEEPFAPLPAHQAYPMLEWGMNWCIGVHTQRFVTLHAAVLERGGRALVLPAPSGSGKSTLCAALAFRGWRLLSDEMALVEPGGRLIMPLVRPISLKGASIDIIRSFAPEASFGERVPDTLKGTVAHCAPPPAAVALDDAPARPGWIVLPQYEAGAATTLQALPKAQALMTLVDCCFNYNIHRRDGFQTLATLVGASGCHRFSYSRLDEAVTVFDRLASAPGQ